MQAFYRLLAVVLLCVMLATLSDVFLTTNNILNVLRQTALLFLMASGLTLVILTAGLDLSIGANVALSACLAASVIKAHRFAVARRGNRHRLRRHGRSCQRHAGDGAEDSVLHRHLRHDVDSHRRHLLLHGRRNHSRLPARLPPARQRLSVRRADAGLRHGGVPVDRRAVRAAHHLGPADLCHRRQPGRRAAVRRAGRAAAGAGLRRQRRDGGARLADHPGAHQFGARRHRRGADAARHRRGAGRRHLAVRRLRHGGGNADRRADSSRSSSTA